MIYTNNLEVIDFSLDAGYTVRITAYDDSDNSFPVTIDIPASCVKSGVLEMPRVSYEDKTFTINFGDAQLSSCAKIIVGDHTSKKVAFISDGVSKAVTSKLTVGSTREYADSKVTSGGPMLERAREDLVIWTKDVTEFSVGAVKVDNTADSGYGGSSSGGGVKKFPTGGVGVVVPPVEEPEETPGKENGKTVFADCDNHWAKDDILYMHENGYVNGMSETLFAPDNNVTRAEFAAMAVRVLGLEQVEYSGAFADVVSSDWYASVVETAYKAGIIQGSDGMFRPNDNITREEMAVILIRVYALGREYTSDTSATFTDAADISDWAKEAVMSAVELKLVNGMTDGRFAPKDNTTRAQAATVFKRLLDINKAKEE